MKTGRRGISFLLGLLLGVLALLPAVSPAMAGSSYQVIRDYFREIYGRPAAAKRCGYISASFGFHLDHCRFESG